MAKFFFALIEFFIKLLYSYIKDIYHKGE